ncbi:MAG: hypothetical protein A3F78_17560 [Burkholderiales bacterium RIFCSPLOWO2_12_FULL_61_40]|nr:MAG: hypothetical protein A3F78_17560 [Burkholderiales bacterium RIFCSPLOWO2_12_FULL_61_40]
MSTGLHRWRFFRAGGFDQVRLDTAAELLAIDELDQKLWVALSCPVNGIEFDPRTLEFIDNDADGHIRAAELISAVHWAKTRLLDPDVLAQKLDGIPIGAIRTDDEEGQRIKTAALTLAADLGKTETDILTVAETSTAQASFASRALSAWEVAGANAKPMGEATQAAYEALTAIADKVEDYFVRCQLAAFDTRAGDALNASEDAFKALAPGALQSGTEAIAQLPLARITPEATLPLSSAGNPAWATRIAALRNLVVAPLLGQQDALTATQWQALKDQFAPYSSWLVSKPDPKLESSGVRELEKISRYVRDLLVLANNFVAFKDFYTRQGKATFQVGTLYLDGRSCDFCVAVNDAGKHAALATLARMCLVYCECVRGTQRMTIAAAFTAGDSDQLMVGRNGVFYDRRGRDWDATIIKIVDHPISLRQAFWSPYKQLSRMVATQLQKVAASKAQESESKLSASVLESVKKGGPLPPPTKPAAPPPFDVGKFAGIFAAIGLAVGAIGTAIASAVTGLFTLAWWQIPLVFAGLLLAISGPAVVLAWFKLRSRNLGPILDANGWAINARARINIPFGTSLTELAQLPTNAERSLSDPYAEKSSRWPLVAMVLGLAVAAVTVWYLRNGG